MSPKRKTKKSEENTKMKDLEQNKNYASIFDLKEGSVINWLGGHKFYMSGDRGAGETQCEKTYNTIKTYINKSVTRMGL